MQLGRVKGVRTPCRILHARGRISACLHSALHACRLPDAGAPCSGAKRQLQGAEAQVQASGQQRRIEQDAGGQSRERSGAGWHRRMRRGNNTEKACFLLL